MKQNKVLKLLSLFVLSTLALLTFSSFQTGGDEDDEEARKRIPVTIGCVYPCYYQDGGGSWYVINRAGTAVDCVRVTYASSCESQGCTPLLPC